MTTTTDPPAPTTSACLWKEGCVDEGDRATAILTSVLLVIAPCIVLVSLVMCCARVFFIYYTQRRHSESRPQTPPRRRRRRHSFTNPSFSPDDLYAVSVVGPLPTYDDLFKNHVAPSSSTTPPAYSEVIVEGVQQSPDSGRSRCVSAPPPSYSPIGAPQVAESSDVVSLPPPIDELSTLFPSIQ